MVKFPSQVTQLGSARRATPGQPSSKASPFPLLCHLWSRSGERTSQPRGKILGLDLALLSM